MENNEILKEIQKTLAEIIDKEDLFLEATSSTLTIEGWDSLVHFQLVMELQNIFNIKFSAAEIQKWKNVGDIIESIHNKQ